MPTDLERKVNFESKKYYVVIKQLLSVFPAVVFLRKIAKKAEEEGIGRYKTLDELLEDINNADAGSLRKTFMKIGAVFRDMFGVRINSDFIPAEGKSDEIETFFSVKKNLPGLLGAGFKNGIRVAAMLAGPVALLNPSNSGWLTSSKLAFARVVDAVSSPLFTLGGSVSRILKGKTNLKDELKLNFEAALAASLSTYIAVMTGQSAFELAQGMQDTTKQNVARQVSQMIARITSSSFLTKLLIKRNERIASRDELVAAYASYSATASVFGQRLVKTIQEGAQNFLDNAKDSLEGSGASSDEVTLREVGRDPHRRILLRRSMSNDSKVGQRIVSSDNPTEGVFQTQGQGSVFDRFIENVRHSNPNDPKILNWANFTSSGERESALQLLRVLADENNSQSIFGVSDIQRGLATVLDVSEDQITPDVVSNFVLKANQLSGGSNWQNMSPEEAKGWLRSTAELLKKNHLEAQSVLNRSEAKSYNFEGLFGDSNTSAVSDIGVQNQPNLSTNNQNIPNSNNQPGQNNQTIPNVNNPLENSSPDAYGGGADINIYIDPNLDPEALAQELVKLGTKIGGEAGNLIKELANFTSYNLGLLDKEILNRVVEIVRNIPIDVIEFLTSQEEFYDLVGILNRIKAGDVPDVELKEILPFLASYLAGALTGAGIFTALGRKNRKKTEQQPQQPTHQPHQQAQTTGDGQPGEGVQSTQQTTNNNQRQPKTPQQPQEEVITDVSQIKALIAQIIAILQQINAALNNEPTSAVGVHEKPGEGGQSTLQQHAQPTDTDSAQTTGGGQPGEGVQSTQQTQPPENFQGNTNLAELLINLERAIQGITPGSNEQFAIIEQQLLNLLNTIEELQRNLRQQMSERNKELQEDINNKIKNLQSQIEQMTNSQTNLSGEDITRIAAEVLEFFKQNITLAALPLVQQVLKKQVDNEEVEKINQAIEQKVNEILALYEVLSGKKPDDTLRDMLSLMKLEDLEKHAEYLRKINKKAVNRVLKSISIKDLPKPEDLTNTNYKKESIEESIKKSIVGQIRQIRERIEQRLNHAKSITQQYRTSLEDFLKILRDEEYLMTLNEEQLKIILKKIKKIDKQFENACFAEIMNHYKEINSNENVVYTSMALSLIKRKVGRFFRFPGIRNRNVAQESSEQNLTKQQFELLSDNLNIVIDKIMDLLVTDGNETLEIEIPGRKLKITKATVDDEQSADRKEKENYDVEIISNTDDPNPSPVDRKVDQDQLKNEILLYLRGLKESDLTSLVVMSSKPNNEKQEFNWESIMSWITEGIFAKKLQLDEQQLKLLRENSDIVRSEIFTLLSESETVTISLGNIELKIQKVVKSGNTRYRLTYKQDQDVEIYERVTQADLEQWLETVLEQWLERNLNLEYEKIYGDINSLRVTAHKKEKGKRKVDTTFSVLHFLQKISSKEEALKPKSTSEEIEPSDNQQLEEIETDEIQDNNLEFSDFNPILDAFEKRFYPFITKLLNEIGDNKTLVIKLRGRGNLTIQNKIETGNEQQSADPQKQYEISEIQNDNGQPPNQENVQSQNVTESELKDKILEFLGLNNNSDVDLNLLSSLMVTVYDGRAIYRYRGIPAQYDFSQILDLSIEPQEKEEISGNIRNTLNFDSLLKIIYSYNEANKGKELALGIFISPTSTSRRLTLTHDEIKKILFNPKSDQNQNEQNGDKNMEGTERERALAFFILQSLTEAYYGTLTKSSRLLIQTEENKFENLLNDKNGLFGELLRIINEVNRDENRNIKKEDLKNIREKMDSLILNRPQNQGGSTEQPEQASNSGTPQNELETNQETNTTLTDEQILQAIQSGVEAYFVGSLKHNRIILPNGSQIYPFMDQQKFWNYLTPKDQKPEKVNAGGGKNN
ncbi:MAG: hypothetical protein KatS3mg086_014 [Candidatus Dojkabacteria bacterium]|nr:MAG: hypothetical protein KatS3mg086_014 [Candidatus Dojkabacteria bacterium]